MKQIYNNAYIHHHSKENFEFLALNPIHCRKSNNVIQFCVEKKNIKYTQ